jgi:hypothetical protein
MNEMADYIPPNSYRNKAQTENAALASHYLDDEKPSQKVYPQ